MITRKGLQVIADALGEVELTTGADAHEVGGIIVGALRRAGQVTPNYDHGRFTTAVTAAVRRGAEVTA